MSHFSLAKVTTNPSTHSMVGGNDLNFVVLSRSIISILYLSRRYDGLQLLQFFCKNCGLLNSNVPKLIELSVHLFHSL